MTHFPIGRPAMILNALCLILASTVCGVFSAPIAAAADEGGEIDNAQSPAEKTAYHHKATGLNFAKEIGDLRQFDVKTFDQKSLGVAIRYKIAGKMTLDVYVYDLDLKDISSDPKSKVIQDQVQMALNDIKRAANQGYYPNLALKSQKVEPMTAEEKGPRAVHVPFTFGDDVTTIHSQLMLLGHRKHFVKIRATYDDENREACEKRIKLLLDDLGKQIVAANGK